MGHNNRSNNFIDIDFQNVSYTVNEGTFNKQKKTILKKISGRFKCGELTAVMGPSGAGKSTLLNILSGFQMNGVTGDIRFTKQDDYKTKGVVVDDGDEDKMIIDTKLRNSSYIMQQDHLCSFFTVYEIMNIAANLKLPRSVSQSKTKRLIIIDDILKKIGLTKVVNTRCWKLSGGQKKRLSIALELIANPSVMFLDEPTTGLDSKNSYKCMCILKSLAKEGRTIICTIHQPTATIFEMIDHVYIVADGRCAYQGSCYNIVPYLQTVGLHCPKYHNPADFMLEVVCGEYGHFTTKLASIAKDTSWRLEQQPPFYHIDGNITNGDPIVKNGKEKKLKEYEYDEDLSNSPSELFRFFILVKICLIKLHRDWTSAYLKLCLHMVVGIFVGLIYTDCGRLGNKSIYNIGFFICSLVYMSYTSLMPAILKFPTELLILRKEIFNNWYKLSTYYLAFLVVNIPTQMLFCVLYSSISYYLSSQILEWNRYLMFLLTCQLVTIISESLGLAFGTLLSPVNGVFCGAVSICYFILFAGYVVMFEHMPRLLYFLSYTSFLRYSFEASLVAVYGYGRLQLECPLPEMYCYYSDPKTILRQLSMDELRYVSDIVVLVFYFLSFSVLSYFSLKIRVKKNN